MDTFLPHSHQQKNGQIHDAIGMPIVASATKLNEKVKTDEQQQIMQQQQQSYIIKPSQKHSEKPQTVLERWLFIIDHLSLFCMVSRMRTPIGRNPLETLTKFESRWLTTPFAVACLGSFFLIKHFSYR